MTGVVIYAQAVAACQEIDGESHLGTKLVIAALAPRMAEA